MYFLSNCGKIVDTFLSLLSHVCGFQAMKEDYDIL